MNGPIHFIAAESWSDAARMLAFEPVIPAFTANLRLTGLRVHVHDHKRALPVERRSLEAHYRGRVETPDAPAFVLSQSLLPESSLDRFNARSFGRDPHDVVISGQPGRSYELGPVPPPDDVDGRSPAVVVWVRSGVMYLIASGTMEASMLLQVAQSIQWPRR